MYHEKLSAVQSDDGEPRRPFRRTRLTRDPWYWQVIPDTHLPSTSRLGHPALLYG